MKTTKTTKASKTTKAPKTAHAADDRSGAYDPAIDKIVKEIGKIATTGRGGDIVVRIVSYNNGPLKCLIARSGVNKDDVAWFSPKVGRLDAKTLTALCALLVKAQKFLA